MHRSHALPRSRTRFHPIAVALLLVSGCSSEKVPLNEEPTTADPSSSTSAAAGSLATADNAAPPTSAGPAKAIGPAKADPDRLVLEGKPVQGALVFATIIGKVASVGFPGHRAVVGDDGKLPIAFYLNAPKSETMKIQFADGSVLEHVFAVEGRTFETEKIDDLPKNVVVFDAKAKAAHDAVEARINAVRMKSGAEVCYEGGFTWPVHGRITSHYGLPRVLDGTDGGIHWGVDLAVPIGTSVKAPACGTVVFAEAGDVLNGTTIVLDHGHGVTSTLLHLADLKKKVGDVVKRGEVLATSGKTGRTTGPHLDWRMNYFEIRVDPELLVAPMPAK